MDLIRFDLRRRRLARALALGGAALGVGCSVPGTTAGVGSAAAVGRAREWAGDADPFTLGVASGLPNAAGATIWTRLAPQPLASGGGMDPVPVRVGWQVFDDDGPDRPVLTGVVVAEPQWGHSVRIELSALRPDRRYRYRFTSGAARSPIGRFHTAPAAGRGERLRLVFASCQQYEQGYYAAWRHAVADDPDLIAFLGDYIYESSWGRRHVRRHDPGVPTTLDAYRRRHALYRSDSDLQAAHAVCAWIPTWDDHEVDNDYAAELSQQGDPAAVFLQRRAAAYQAWFEHMPVPWSMRPAGASMRIHGNLDWGGLTRLHLLDGRQYRSVQACRPAGRAGSGEVGSDCLERLDPARTLLGAEQEAWFARSMRDSRARWNLVAQQTLIGRRVLRRPSGERWWTDGWDGYPAARRRLLEAVSTSGAGNPVALGGDVHTFYAGELHEDFDRPTVRPAMLEFVGGSITSQAVAQPRIDAIVAGNPNLHYGEGRWRGYGWLDLEPHRMRIAMRGIDDPADPAAGCRTLRTFEVRDGSGRIES